MLQDAFQRIFYNNNLVKYFRNLIPISAKCNGFNQSKPTNIHCISSMQTVGSHCVGVSMFQIYTRAPSKFSF